MDSAVTTPTPVTATPHPPRPHFQRGGRSGAGRTRGSNNRGPGRGGEMHVGRGAANQRGQRLTANAYASSNSEIAPRVPQRQLADVHISQKEENINMVDEAEAEVCFICASTVIHNSVAPCNHRTCHICSLRMRALYKTNACAHCRVSFALNGGFGAPANWGLGSIRICHIHR